MSTVQITSTVCARSGAWRVAAAVALALSGLSAVQAAEAAGDSEEGITEVIVTGSRIVRRDLEAASPVVTVTDQVFNESSTLAVESVLNQLPQFVPANTQFNTADVFPSATSTPGISTVSLRGLGANRTLVLVDGRRAQPINSTLVVDTNSIPSSALESVEIISGGASAVYGADALGGVTNFKLKSNFQGLDMQLRSGMTERGDGEENRVSALMGANIGDGRGNVMLGLEWTERQQVLAVDRPFFSSALKDPTTNSTSNVRLNGFSYEPGVGGTPSQAAANTLFPERPVGYNVSRTTSFYFNPDNSVFKTDLRGLGWAGDIANDPAYKINPSGVLTLNNLANRYSSPMERYSLFGKGNFKINDAIEAFSQVNFVNTTNRQVLQPSGAVGGFGATIPYGADIYGPSRNANGTTRAEYLAGGAFGLSCPATGGCTQSQAFPVPTELAALLNSRGANVTSNATTPISYDAVTGLPVVISGVDGNWRLGGTFDFLPVRQIENATNLYQLMVGFRGDLGLGDWTWEAYGSHGSTRTDLDYIGFVSTARWQALASAPNFGKGASIAGAGSTAATCTSGLPVFGGTITEDCVKAISARYTDRTRLSQDIVEATAQGALFSLPAGEVRSAVGLVQRTNNFQYLPDASRVRESFLDVPVGAFGQANVFGKTTVKEIYGELLVPVLKDVFMAKSLELELGYRYSDYDTAGNVPTWKALFSWAPVDWARFRGGYQVANRAPNINELFLDASSQAVTMANAEPCRSDTRAAWGNVATNPNRSQVQALCTALIGNSTSTFSLDPNNYLEGRGDGVILQLSSGNRALRSEEGKTWTLGVVLRSPFENPVVSGATLALDWYKVKITDAISTITASSSYDLCFNRDGQSNPTYSLDDPNGVCRNLIRDETNGAAGQVLSQYQNLGIIRTSGIDANLNWRADVADLGLESIPGALSLNVSYTKLFEFKAQEYATQVPLENAKTLARGGMFGWRTVTTMRYSHNNWDVALNWRHLPPVRNSLYVTDPNTTVRGAGEYNVYGLTGNWDISKQWALTVGIDNLFDRQPERVGAGQIQTIAALNGGGQTVLSGAASTSAGYYDVLGRRYFVNLKMRL
ncbi:MAG: TonB-dependent receptor [Proteobacteria bacterium]|nr:TonB-dependent receptor [Pseudomonadota bacterium]